MTSSWSFLRRCLSSQSAEINRRFNTVESSRAWPAGFSLAYHRHKQPSSRPLLAGKQSDALRILIGRADIKGSKIQTYAPYVIPTTGNKSKEHGLSLSRSWQQRPLYYLQHPVLYSRRLQGIYPHQNLILIFAGFWDNTSVSQEPSLLWFPTKSIFNRLTWCSKIIASSIVSDLEAFSHKRTHGGVTALVFQLTVYTNYVKKGFLSY